MWRPSRAASPCQPGDTHPSGRRGAVGDALAGFAKHGAQACVGFETERIYSLLVGPPDFIRLCSRLQPEIVVHGEMLFALIVNVPLHRTHLDYLEVISP